MAKSSVASKVESLGLPKIIADRVQAWRNQGYHPFPTETTRQLLHHWFEREHEDGARFHPCQQGAIEAIAQQFGALFA